MSEEPTTNDVPQDASTDLLELVSRGIAAEIDERLGVCSAMLDEAGEPAEPRRPFYLVAGNDHSVRLYGVQGESKHAAFVVALGFDPDGPDALVAAQPPTLHDGVLDLAEADASSDSGSESPDVVE